MAATRPGFVTLYFDQVDHAGHDFGPSSAEVRAAQAEVDAALARLLAGLDARGLRARVDLPSRTRYRLVGVALANFVSDDALPLQPPLFAPATR